MSDETFEMVRRKCMRLHEDVQRLQAQLDSLQVAYDIAVTDNQLLCVALGRIEKRLDESDRIDRESALWSDLTDTLR